METLTPDTRLKARTIYREDCDNGRHWFMITTYDRMSPVYHYYELSDRRQRACVKALGYQPDSGDMVWLARGEWYALGNFTHGNFAPFDGAFGTSYWTHDRVKIVETDRGLCALMAFCCQRDV